MSITHSELVKALVKSGEVIAAEMTPAEADLWHAATGVMGEATEILDAVSGSANLDRENMVEELGDIEFYLEQTRQNLSIDREAVVAKAIGVAYTLVGAATQLTIWSGHLLDQTKKVAVYKKPTAKDAFLDVLAQLETALLALYLKTDITRDEAVAGNIAKLSVRYAGLTYSNEAAQTRADKN